MSLWTRIFGGGPPALEPRAAVQSAGGGRLITNSADLEEVMRAGSMSSAGMPVTPETAMRETTVFACVRIRSGVPANMPLHIKKKVDERTRENATDESLWNIFARRPNRWQTPSQFKRMMTAHNLLRGNAYAMIVRSRGEVKELVPLHPDRTECNQLDDLSLEYTYTRKNGGKITLPQREVFHLVGLTLDGVHGVSPIHYARETIGLSLAMEDHGNSTFKNGARASNVLTHPQKLGKEGLEFLKASLDTFRAGEANEGKSLILEEGMTVGPLSMTAADAQWIESRKFSRTDIAMIFGVPPHMIGDTEKSTSWGTGIEQQTQGFVTFTSEDDLTTWEETINRDLISQPELYARFNRAALVRGDLKTRWETYAKGRRMKVLSANDVRVFEDMNPVDGGDVYENPEITVPDEENADDTAKSARD